MRSMVILSKASSIILLLLSGVVGLADGLVATNEVPEFVPKYTGIRKEITWKLANKPIPLHKELTLLKSRVLWRGGFSLLNGKRLAEVEQKCLELGMTVNQGLLIRKQLQVTHTMRNTWKLKERFNDIEEIFRKKRKTLLELSRDLGLPPVNILRELIRQRVFEAYPEMRPSDRKQIVKKIINEDDQTLVNQFLTDWELNELQVAKEFDVIGYEFAPSEIESAKWEKAMYSFLSENNINFLTEDDMRAAGSRITPDCLILDDCTINGRKVRWIDAKNFYGSGLRESSGISKKMNKQIAKYNAEFDGDGAILFKHGFSKKFLGTFPSTLFLDAGQLELTY